MFHVGESFATPIGYLNTTDVGVTINDEDANLCTQPPTPSKEPGWFLWPMIVGGVPPAGHHQGYGQVGVMRSPGWSLPRFFNESDSGACLVGQEGPACFDRSWVLSPAWTVHTTHRFYVRYRPYHTYTGCWGGCFSYGMDDTILGVSPFNPSNPNGYWTQGWSSQFYGETHNMADDLPEVQFTNIQYRNDLTTWVRPPGPGHLSSTSPYLKCEWLNNPIAFMVWSNHLDAQPCAA